MFAIAFLYSFFHLGNAWISGNATQLRKENFSYVPRLRLLRNESVSPGKIFCSQNVTEERFPLYRGVLLYMDSVIGIYKLRSDASHICFYQVVESNLSDASWLSGGELLTIGKHNTTI